MLNFNKIEEFLGTPLTNEEKEQINQLEETKIVKNFDLTGKIFNRLIVLGRGPSYVASSGHKTGQWWCMCQCSEHNILLVRSNNLQSNNTKSCGCLNKEKSTERIVQTGHNCAKNIAGQKFNELTAIKPTEKRNNGSVVWECRCSCGKQHFVSAKDLINNRIKSCGHPTESSGIRKIKTILNENNIKYITEKTFSTCKFEDTNASARFDFYLPDYNILIEFDGVQHYREQDLNYFKDSLEKRQQHDKYKTNWCQKNHIQLIRIPYYKEDEISLSMLLKGVDK